MKLLLLILVFLWGTAKVSSQVGINTIDPKAQLDIAVSNSAAPSILDGILIPRINDFSHAQPTTDQHGMLVFLTTAKEGFPIGFYFWNNEILEWMPIRGSDLESYFQSDAGSFSDRLTASIYREGKVGIGANIEGAKLGVVISEDSTRTGIEVLNASLPSGKVTYSILATNKSVTTARKYGIKNTVSADGGGEHYGIYNETYQSLRGPTYGIYNKVGRTIGVNDLHYGIYNEIGTAAGAGYAYGIYSKAIAADSSKVFAGYFEGRLAVADSGGVKYIFPNERGVENQVLAAGANGEMKWLDSWGREYTETGDFVGGYEISSNVGTLQIGEGVLNIVIPASSMNKGRKLVLIAPAGVSFKSFAFRGGDTVIDVLTGSQISGIKGGERLVIQSTGSKWIVIGE